jgi:hypothetical protein
MHVSYQDLHDALRRALAATGLARRANLANGIPVDGRSWQSVEACASAR